MTRTSFGIASFVAILISLWFYMNNNQEGYLHFANASMICLLIVLYDKAKDVEKHIKKNYSRR